jgi:hypothetical protein
MAFRGVTRGIFTGLLLCAFFSCGSFAAKESRNVPDDFLGINPHNYIFQGEGAKLLDNLGIVWIRRDAYWGSLEDGKGNWDFSGLDKIIESDKKNGKKDILILNYDAAWIHSNGEKRPNVTLDELPYYLNFVETVVKRYKGRIEAYEIWNEPNYKRFWKGSEKDFFELTKQAALKIRECDSGAKIVAGAFSWVPQGYVKRMFSYGAMENVDAVSFHPYDINPYRVVSLYKTIARIAAQFSFKGEIWVSEAGYPTAGWYPHKVSEKRFPEYIVKTIAGFSVQNVRALLWYTLFDEYNKGEEVSKWDSEDFFGLVYPDFTAKNGAAAFALCGKYIQGRKYDPAFPQRLNIPASIDSLCFAGEDGSNTLVIWNNGLGAIKLHLTLGGTDHFLHNIETGNPEPFQDASVINVSSTPVFITWQGDISNAILQ